MKLRKIFSIAVVTLGLVALITASVGAAESWYYNVTVEAVGAFSNDDWNACWISLTNQDNPGAYTGVWFKLHTDFSKQMLATALTAKSAGAKVWALVDFDAPNSFAYAIMLAD